jgi:hypothetical protein
MNERGDDWVEDNPTAAAMEPRGDAWEQTKQRAGRMRERTQLFVRENPLPMIIGAFLIGAAAGFAIRLGTDSKEEAKTPARAFNWSFLSVPFLWPLIQSLRERYDDSADAVKDNVDRLKSIDLDRYTKPIRKRWKSWLS